MPTASRTMTTIIVTEIRSFFVLVGMMSVAGCVVKILTTGGDVAKDERGVVVGIIPVLPRFQNW